MVISFTIDGRIVARLHNGPICFGGNGSKARGCHHDLGNVNPNRAFAFCIVEHWRFVAGGVQVADAMIDQLAAMIEAGGLPATVGGTLLLLLYKFGGKRDDTEATLAAALNALTKEVRDMRQEMTDRFARVETDVKHLGRDK